MITLDLFMNNVVSPIQDVEIFTHETGLLYAGIAERFNTKTAHEYDYYLVDAVYTVASEDILYISVKRVIL